jgi:hypothetical protein
LTVVGALLWAALALIGAVRTPIWPRTGRAVKALRAALVIEGAAVVAARLITARAIATLGAIKGTLALRRAVERACAVIGSVE